MLVGTVVILPRLDIRANSPFNITHTSQEDFAGGSVSETLDIDVSPGEVRLRQDKYTEDSNLEDGYSPAVDATVSENSISINKEYAYSTLSDPALASNNVIHSFLDPISGYLYVSTNEGGLSVIDSEANTLVTRYHTGSTPALASNSVSHSFLDPTTGYLYVSTNEGLSVIDTEANTLVMQYHGSSTPALRSDNVVHSFLDPITGYLYVSCGGGGSIGGLSVINTNTNTLVTDYHTGSIPALTNNNTRHSFIDPVTEYLYVSMLGSNGGVIVIDVNTNTLVTRYHTGSAPVLISDLVSSSFLDPVSSYLYVHTWSGMSVINTETNALITHYNLDSTPALLADSANDSFLDPVTGYLYVATYNGISVINTETNTLVAHNHPGFAKGSEHLFIDSDTSSLYTSTGDGVGIISLSNQYNLSGRYIALPLLLSQPWHNVSWEEVIGDYGEVSLQYRTGYQDSVWIDQFATAENHVEDPYDWDESEFQIISTGNGVITLSDDDGFGYAWFDTRMAEDFFPTDSVVQARVRIQTEGEDVYLRIFADEDEGAYSSKRMVDNEWVTFILVPQVPFSLIGFEMQAEGGGWSPEDSFQIDWISVIQPDDQWSDWSEPCSTSTGCTIDPADLEGKEWIQYRLNLSTDDPTQTPIVNSVTFASGYQDSGEFVSSVVDAGQIVDWDTLTAEATTPSGTSIAFFTRSGNTATPDGTWSDWSVVNSPITSPNGQYLQYKTVLTTTDENVTPVLNSVTLGYATLETTLTPTPTPIPGTVPPPTFITLGKIGGQPVTDGVYTYYFDNGKNLTFSGTTSPNAYVLLTIESDPVTCETQADDEGEWSCTFSEEIPDGYHTLTVSAYYEGSAVLSSEKYTLGIGVGLAETGAPAMVSLLTGGVLLIGGAVVWHRRKEH